MEVMMRRARRSDAAAINVIFNQAIEDGNANLDIDCKDLAYRQQWLADHDKRHPVFVGEMDGEIACWVALSPYSGRYPYDCVAELSIYVRRDLRGMGLGGLLLKFIEQQAADLGYYKIVLSVFGGNQAALHAYRRAGYRDVGVFRNHGYYKGKLVDIVFMERLLVPDMEFLKQYYRERYPFYEEFFAQQQAEEEATLRRNGMLPPLEGEGLEEEFEEVPVEDPAALPEGIVRFLRSKKKPDYRKLVEASRRQEAEEREAKEQEADPERAEEPQEGSQLAPVEAEEETAAPETPQAERPEEAGAEAVSPPPSEGPAVPETPEPPQGEQPEGKQEKAPAEPPPVKAPRDGDASQSSKKRSGGRPRKKKPDQEEGDGPLEGQLNLEDVISNK